MRYWGIQNQDDGYWLVNTNRIVIAFDSPDLAVATYYSFARFSKPSWEHEWKVAEITSASAVPLNKSSHDSNSTNPDYRGPRADDPLGQV